MREKIYPVPCIRATEFDCPRICTFYPLSAIIFWDTVYDYQSSPEDMRKKLIEQSGPEDSKFSEELVEKELRSSGQIYLCRSYIVGC